MIASNVPVVPGYHGKNQDPQFLKQKALEIGYPVLIKAIKGGGGKGMRIVNDLSEFDIQLKSFKREAMKSFRDDQVLIEKYLLTLVTSKYNLYWYATWRNTAPGLSDEIRMELGAKAVATAKAVNYVSTGTHNLLVWTI